jgi:catechol 2,3-dioxygenase-like lactoylglutathione lyase family enzyme
MTGPLDGRGGEGSRRAAFFARFASPAPYMKRARRQGLRRRGDLTQEMDPARIKALGRPYGMPFNITKIGHVVLNCTDLERSTRFYTEVLGFRVSDVYTKDVAPGGMVFMRCAADHHGVALVGSMPGESPAIELNHMAFEVATLDEVLRARTHLQKNGVTIDFEGRRRAGAQIAVEFRDPDGHRLEIFWGLDQLGSQGSSRPPEEWIWAHTLEEAIANPVRGQDTTVQDKTLLRRWTAEEEQRNREHSISTQTAKLGPKG